MPVPAAHARFMDPALLALAREVAADIHDIQTILSKHGMSRQEWDALEHDPEFVRLLTTMVAEWNAAGNTAERIRLKAQATLELGLENLARKVMADDAPAGTIIDGLKLMKDLGEVGAKAPQSVSLPAGAGFSVTINIGQGVAPRTIEGTAIEVASP